MSVFLIASCHTYDANLQRLQHLEKNDALCAIANNKRLHLGQEIVISGTMVTDFRHFSMLEAKCESGEGGLNFGKILPSEKNIEIEKMWWKSYCGSEKPSCLTYVPVKLRGKLVDGNDGIALDVIEIIDSGIK